MYDIFFGATYQKRQSAFRLAVFFCFALGGSVLCSTGYETDERGSLGRSSPRRRRRKAITRSP